MKMYELKEYLDGFMQFQHWRDAEIVVEIPDGDSTIQVRAMIVFQDITEVSGPPNPGHIRDDVARLVFKRDEKVPLIDEPSNE